MLADRQLLVVGGTGDGTVDAGELPAVLLVPGPDFRRHVGGGVGHGEGSGEKDAPALISPRTADGKPCRPCVRRGPRDRVMHSTSPRTTCTRARICRARRTASRNTACARKMRCQIRIGIAQDDGLASMSLRSRLQ